MPSVTIQVEGPVGKRTLSEAVGEWFAGRNLPPPERRYVSALGHELAEVVVYQGERSRGRAVFALHENMLYLLSFHPLDQRFARAAPHVEAAWEMVIGSFALCRARDDSRLGPLSEGNIRLWTDVRLARVQYHGASSWGWRAHLPPLFSQKRKC